MDQMQLLSLLDEGIKSHFPRTMMLSDWMADHPELSGEEVEATARIIEMLKSAGFSVQENLLDLKTAFRATIGSGEPRVALLVECDALPEIGHACGHCLSASMSVLAALALAPLMKEVKGTLEVIGTPAEETFGAKCIMAEKGVFDGLALVVMIHASAKVSAVGYRSLALDGYRFSFKGRSSHAAASPWVGRSALSALELFFHAMALLRLQSRPTARIHGIICDGGSVTNVIPEKAASLFELREIKRDYLNELVSRACDCAHAAAIATETNVNWEKFMPSFDEMIPNPPGERMVGDIYRDLGIQFERCSNPEGSSDIGNVSHRCPALQPMLAVTSHDYALHTRDFAGILKEKEAHEALLKGGLVLGRIALRTFIDEKLRSEMSVILK